MPLCPVQACEDHALLHSLHQAHSSLLEATAKIDAWHATQHWLFPRLGFLEPEPLRKLMALSEMDYGGLQAFLPLLFSGASAWCAVHVLMSVSTAEAQHDTSERLSWQMQETGPGCLCCPVLSSLLMLALSRGGWLEHGARLRVRNQECGIWVELHSLILLHLAPRFSCMHQAP